MRAYWYNEKKEDRREKMEQWKQDKRRDVVMVDIDQLVPRDHLLRKIEKVMDYDWLYERLSPYYCHGVGRNRPCSAHKDGIDPRSVRHTVIAPNILADTVECRVSVVLGYSLLDRIPHFATVSYAFCKRFLS